MGKKKQAKPTTRRGGKRSGGLGFKRGPLKCNDCDGTGTKDGKVCPHCDGSGER